MVLDSTGRAANWSCLWKWEALPETRSVLIDFPLSSSIAMTILPALRVPIESLICSHPSHHFTPQLRKKPWNLNGSMLCTQGSQLSIPVFGRLQWQNIHAIYYDQQWWQGLMGSFWQDEESSSPARVHCHTILTDNDCCIVCRLSCIHFAVQWFTEDLKKALVRNDRSKQLEMIDVISWCAWADRTENP